MKPPLTTTHPELAAQWHPTLNGDLTAEMVTAGSEKKAWWLGECGHEWDMSIGKRVARHQNCPYCSNQRILVGYNDLTTTHPELTTQWHPTFNGELTPEKVSKGSDKKVWWLGECGHEWDMSIGSRSRNNYGCPYCSGQKVLAGYNDLATTHPELTAQWHPTKNGELTPEMVSRGSREKVWWFGECGHEWDMMIASRLKAQKLTCAICNGQRTLVGYNDLATTHPQLASEWHPTLNSDLCVNMTSAGSDKKVWWLGACGHEWDMSIGDRSRKNFGCPYCSGRRILVGFNDLATVNPEVAKLWHPTKNGELTPQMVTAGSNKFAWWICRLGHTVHAEIYTFNKLESCPICCNKEVLTNFNDLSSLSPVLASQWHPTKNGTLTPQMVTSTSTKKVWWQDKLGHEWQATIHSRKTRNCPVCSGRKVWAGKTDLATLRPDLVAQWHPTLNGDLTPQQVTPASRLNVWWMGTCGLGHEWQSQLVHMRNGQGKCLVCIGKKIQIGFNDLPTTHPQLASEWHPTKNESYAITAVSKGITRSYWWLGKCGHEWKASPNSRTRRGHGRGCPYCANQKVLVGFNDLLSQDPVLAAQWHPTLNGDLTSEMVVANSNRKVWWQCAQGHEWVSSVFNRRSGSGCHTCSSARTVSSSEQELADYVMSLGVKVVQSDHSLIHKELDLYLLELNVAIEYNGLYYHSEKKGIGAKYHRDKWLRCKNKGVDLIQIWEDEWINKSELVKRLLADRLLSNQEHLSVKNHTASKLDGDYAREFLHRNSLNNIELDAEEYYGLSIFGGDLHAVVGINFDEENTSFEITYCATSVLLEETFLSMILEQITQESGVHHFQVVDDHCFSFAELYERNGFTTQSELSPSFMYVKQLTRSTSPQSKKKDGLNRIWNAGSTRWVRNR